MSRYVSREDFRKHTRERHSRFFGIHHRVAKALEMPIRTPRRAATPLETALDFLFVQAYKSHDTVGLLAAEGLAGDAATITRRLLELGIQAVYIGADSEASECESRAGRFLAFLWRETDPAAKELLTADAREYWDDIARRFGKGISANASRWGPSFWDMFVYAEKEETYEDYALLSRIAHGGPEEFVLHHSSPTFPLRSTLHVPVALLFSSRYYLGVADVWNRQFQLIEDSVIRDLTALVTTDHMSADGRREGLSKEEVTSTKG